MTIVLLPLDTSPMPEAANTGNDAGGAIRARLASILPPGWRIQFGRWTAGEHDGAERYAVVRPMGGAPAELVRRPMYSLTLLGARSEQTASVASVANTVVESLRVATAATHGIGVVALQASEPVYSETTDGRPMFEMAVSAITN